MKFSHLILAAALALGLGGAASATPLAVDPAELIQSGTTLEYAKRKGHRGWKGHKGRHYGWYRGRHRGWHRRHRHVYYAPRRYHRWHHRRAYYAYPRRHYGYGYYPRRRGIYIHF
jgi:hypothetical protein